MIGGERRVGCIGRLGLTYIHSVQSSSVSQSCPTSCNPMDCSIPGLSVHLQPQSLLSDAIQQSNPLLVPFSSHLQSFPASGSFQMSQLFASYGQTIGASASVLPMNIQGRFPLGLTGLASLYPRDSQESSPASQFEKINSLVLSLLHSPTHIHT